MGYTPLRLEGDWEIDEPFLTVKLDGWWALGRVDDCADDLEGVDIEKRADKAGSTAYPVLGCSTMELIWLVALFERGFG